MLNVLPHQAGYTTRRGGYRITRKCDDYTTRIAGVFGGRFTGRTGDDFIVISEDKLNGGDSYQEHTLYSQFDRVGVSMTSDGAFGMVVGTVPDYAVAGTTLFIANTNRPVISYTKAGTVTFEEKIPQCSYIAMHKTRMWCGNLKDSADSIWYSMVGDYRGFLDPRPDAEPYQGETREHFDSRQRESQRFSLSDRSDQVVTGLSDSFYGDIYAFTTRSINRCRVDGQNFLARDIVSQAIGCSGNQTIRSVGNDLIWISEKGVHSLITTQKFGDVEESFLSLPIQRLWDRINPENMQLAQAVYVPKQELYLLAIDTGQASSLSIAGNGPTILCLHVPSGRWSVWDIPATALTTSNYEGHYGANVIAGAMIGAQGTVGVLGTMDSFDLITDVPADHPPTFTPTAFTSVVETEWINANDPVVKKNWRGVTIYFRSGADAVAKLYWQSDSPQYATAGETEKYRHPTAGLPFHLNPGAGMPTLDDANETPMPSPFQWGMRLGDSNTAPKKAFIPLSVSSNSIKIWIESDSGHPFDLFGIDVHYIPESSRPREVSETGTERTLAIASSQSMAKVGTRIGAGDSSAVPG